MRSGTRRRGLAGGVLGRIPDDAILINTSRGAIINEADFVATLEAGRIGGAGLDIIHGEWDTRLQEHPLVRYANTHENLVISPHTGGITFESQSAAMRFIVDKPGRTLRELWDTGTGGAS